MVLEQSSTAGVYGTAPGEAFHAIAEAMPQLVWTARPDGRIDYFNERWLEYSGLSREEFRNRGKDVGIVHPDEAPRTFESWKGAVGSGEPFEIEHRLRRHDGTYRWFLTRASAVRRNDGAVVRWIGTSTDVDEQRRARDSLRFLVDAGKVVASTLDVVRICRSLADVTVEEFADWCFVSLVRDGSIGTVAIAHRDERLVDLVQRYRDRYPLRAGDRLAKVISEKEPLLMARITDDMLREAARDDEHLRLLRALRMHSVISVPLAGSEGRVHGAITIVSAESGRSFDANDVAVAQAVANSAATAIENARTFQTERRSAERLRFTGRVSELLFEGSDPWRAMDGIAEMVALEIADACAILSLRDGAVRVEAIAHRDPNAHAAVAALRGQRLLRPETEPEFARELGRSEPFLRAGDGSGGAWGEVWPYLARPVAEIGARRSVVVPIRSGAATFGALVAFYADADGDPSDDLALLGEIAARASVAVDRAETLERQRNIAATLQRASLPSLIPKPSGLHLDAVYLPAGHDTEVGGDWYDVIELDDGSVVVSVGDVTGRGIEAAAIMSKVRHAMGITPLHERDPAKILDSAGWFLAKRYPHAIVTAFVGVIDPERTTMRYATAGHPLPIVRREGDLIELSASGLPLGLRLLDESPASSEFAFKDGDLMVLYTDGLIEVERDLERGERNLRELLSSDALSATASPAHLIACSCLPDEVHDDVAILAVSVGKVPVWLFACEDARAAIDARAQFAAYLRSRSDDADFLGRAELIFGELLGNVVRHAPGAVEISLCWDEGAPPALHVIDRGKPFDPGGHLPADVFSDQGRGLFIVERLARAVAIEYLPNCGNHIRVTL